MKLQEKTMKLHKIVLLVSISILPIQELLAANANKERLVQPAATMKSTIVIPAQKLSPVLPGKKQGGGIAGPGGTATGVVQTTVRESVKARLGVNLKLLSVSWDGEICTSGCPGLRRYDLAIPSCDIAFQVKNTGDVASGNFHVRLLRTVQTGTEVPLDISDGQYNLAPHETKTFTVELGLYKPNHPFTVTLDPLNRIAETNENDNRISLVLPH